MKQKDSKEQIKKEWTKTRLILPSQLSHIQLSILSEIFASWKYLFAGGSQDKSVFPLSHVTALSVCQWRIGIDDSILNQISQRKDVALEVESF